MVGMTKASAVSPGGPVPVRWVGDVETLKVLSDPLRLGILRLLMRDVTHHPAVMTVKEIADTLGEPPTKLYRHVKQLEARGLIQVAETRLVSGILESRYRAGQHSLDIDRDLLNAAGHSGETQAMVRAAFDDFRNEFVAAITTGTTRLDHSYPPEQRYRRPIIAVSEARLAPERASELRDRLAALITEYFQDGDIPDGVPVRLLVGYLAPGD